MTSREVGLAPADAGDLESLATEQVAAKPDAKESAKGGDKPEPVADERGLRGYLRLVIQLIPFIPLTQILEPRLVPGVVLATAGFMIHYWLSVRYKEWFWFGISGVGLFLLWDVLTASLIAASTVIIFGILSLRASFWLRVATLLAFFGAIIAVAVASNATLPLPKEFFFLFCHIFAYRLLTYLYDLYHSKKNARLLDYLRCYCSLPNYMFGIFPFLDPAVVRSCYRRRDIHVVAQEGVRWIFRGAVQLAILIALRGAIPQWFPEEMTGDEATSAIDVVGIIYMSFIGYFSISGVFHVCIGMMKLFGYDLPQANNNYALSRSPVDFWRRANIYWKDAMVKVVFLPVVLKYRKYPRTALVVAMVGVCALSWALHVWEKHWEVGFRSWAFGTLHWGWFEAAVLASGALLWEDWQSRRRGKRGKSARPAPEPSRIRRITKRAGSIGLHVLQSSIIVTAVAVGWTYERCSSFDVFFDMLRWWD